MLKTLKILMAILILITNYSALPAQSKKIVILDFLSAKDQKNFTRYIKSNIVVNLIKKNKYDILEREILKRILKEKNMSIKNCKKSDECAIWVGQLVSADYLITGEVNYLNNYSINVRIIDVKEGKIISADSFQLKSKKNILDKVNIISNNIEKYLDKHVEKIKTKGLSKKNITVKITGNYLIPLSDFSDLVKNGDGSLININYSNILFENFIIGFKTGFFYYPGKETIKYSYNIPVLFNTGYSFNITDNFNIIPVISFGPVYNSLKNSESSKSKTESMLSAGLNFN